MKVLVDSEGKAASLDEIAAALAQDAATAEPAGRAALYELADYLRIQAAEFRIRLTDERPNP